METVSTLNLDELLDEKNITKARNEADKQMSVLSTDEWKYLRRRAKHDLFFLSTGVLGYKKLSVNLHGNLSTWLQGTDNEQFREILLPRGHYKSTVITIADSVRIVLPDDGFDSPWPRNLGTNCRLAIGHEVAEEAGRFLGSITAHFLSNPILMGLFPECVPTPRKHRINSSQLELPRDEIWNEPTIDTFGVGARSQGRHYNFLKLDDLFGDKARDSAAERRATYDWFDNIQAFFSTFSKDHFDLVGTRWAFDDLYSHAEHLYGDALKKYVRGVEETNEAGERVTIFPEEFPIEKLHILKKNPKIFSAQYANDPKEGATEFDQSWKRFYEWDGEHRVRVHGTLVNVRDGTDNVILIDPAMTGKAGYVVTAMDDKERVFILKAKKHNWKPPELVNELFLDVMRWQPRLVVIEAVLFSELFQHWIIREQAARGIRFRIEPARTRQRSKESRVRGLSNYLSAGQIFFHASQADLLEEYDAFGATSDYHILDALAYGPEFWKKGGYINRAGQIAQTMMEGRDLQTGYSQQ